MREGKEGGSERERKGGNEGWMREEGYREGKGGREGGRKGGTEGGREGGR